MAAVVKLPDELFNSLLNGFGGESGEKILYINPGKKSKTNANDNITVLPLRQKKRIANIAGDFFSLDSVKNIFEKNFVKYVDKVQEQEVTQAVAQIIEDVKEDAEKKKEKKKFNLRSSIRKYRMLLRFYTFAQQVFNNFKKFQRHANEILDKHRGMDDVTLQEALTDEKKRKKYIEQKKKLFGDLIMSFYEDVILGSVIPAVELVIRMLIDALLEVFRKLQELKEKYGDALLTGLKKGGKVIGKILAKAGVKLGAKMASRHAAATAVGTVGTPVGIAVLNAVSVAWDVYDAINLAVNVYDLYQSGKKAYDEIGSTLIGWTESAIASIEKAEQSIDGIVGKFGDNLKNSANRIKGRINQDFNALRDVNEQQILNKKETKTALFNEVYKSIEENRGEAVEAFLKNKTNYKDFTKTEIEYMQKKGMDTEQYVPYDVYGVTWLDFFNKFVGAMETTMHDIEENTVAAGNYNFGFSEQIRGELEKVSGSAKVEDFKEPEIKRAERKIEETRMHPDETWEYNNFLTNFRIELAENRTLQQQRSAAFADIKEIYEKIAERLMQKERLHFRRL